MFDYQKVKFLSQLESLLCDALKGCDDLFKDSDLCKSLSSALSVVVSMVSYEIEQ